MLLLLLVNPSQYLVLYNITARRSAARSPNMHSPRGAGPSKVTEGFRRYWMHPQTHCDSQSVVSTQLESELETGHEHERAGQDFIPYAYGQTFCPFLCHSCWGRGRGCWQVVCLCLCLLSVTFPPSQREARSKPRSAQSPCFGTSLYRTLYVYLEKYEQATVSTCTKKGKCVYNRGLTSTDL